MQVRLHEILQLDRLYLGIYLLRFFLEHAQERGRCKKCIRNAVTFTIHYEWNSSLTWLHRSMTMIDYQSLTSFCEAFRHPGDTGKRGGSKICLRNMSQLLSLVNKKMRKTTVRMYRELTWWWNHTHLPNIVCLLRKQTEGKCTVLVQDGKPKTEQRRKASLMSISHKICITDDMLMLVLKITSNFHTCFDFERTETPRNAILKVLGQFLHDFFFIWLPEWKSPVLSCTAYRRTKEMCSTLRVVCVSHSRLSWTLWLIWRIAPYATIKGHI